MRYAGAARFFALEQCLHSLPLDVVNSVFSVSMSRTRSSPKLMDTLRCYSTPKAVREARSADRIIVLGKDNVTHAEGKRSDHADNAQ